MSGFLGSALGGLFGSGAEGTGAQGTGAQGTGAQGTGERAGNMLSSVMSEAGGVQGILAKADQAGLGDKVRSWIGNGENWPISPDEIEKIFPSDQIDGWAQQHGVPAGAVPQILSYVLPHAVDHATPDGDASAATDGIAAGGTDPDTVSQAGAGGFDFGGLAKRLFGS